MPKPVQFLEYEWLIRLGGHISIPSLDSTEESDDIYGSAPVPIREAPPPEAPPRSPSPEEPPLLPLVVFHLYVRRQEKYMTGVMSEPIDLNGSFEAVFDELVSHVLDKIGDINGDSSKYNIVFATKWVTGKTANTNPKKGANPVEVNSFADFKRESNLLALRTTIADAVKRKRKVLTVGGNVLQIVATVTANLAEPLEIEVVESLITETPAPQVFHHCQC